MAVNAGNRPSTTLGRSPETAANTVPLAKGSPWQGAPLEREVARAVSYNMIRCRQAKGWSMRKVAQALGTTPDRIAALELCRTAPLGTDAGQTDPTLAEVIRLAGLFEVTVERMMMPLAGPPRLCQSFLDAPNPPPPEIEAEGEDQAAAELLFDTLHLPNLGLLLAARFADP